MNVRAWCEELLGDAHAAVAVFEGPTAVLTYANAGYLELVPAGDTAIGRNLAELERAPFAGVAMRAHATREAAADARAHCGARAFQVAARPLTDGGVVLFALEVAPRLQAETHEILSALKEGIVVHDASGAIVEANEAAAKLLGVPREQIKGLDSWAAPWDVIDENGSPSPPEARPVHVVLRKGVPHASAVLGVQRSDGTLLWIDTRASALYGDDGKTMIGAVTSLFDVTEKKSLDARYAEIAEQFRATFEQAAVGMAHVSPDGRFLRVNQRLTEIVGYPREELVQKRFQDLTHPDDLELDLDHARRLLTGELTHYTLEKRYIRADGAQVWINLTGSAVRDAKGDVLYFIAVIEDISARRAEEQRRRLFQAMAEKSHDFISFASMDGRILYVNEAGMRLVGLESLERALEHTVLDFTPPDEADVATKVVLPAILRDGAWQGEVMFRHFQTGERIPFHCSAFSLAVGDQKVIATLSRALTAEKALERERAAATEADRRARERAEEASRAKDEFIAIVSHELRTPLNAILGWANLLAEGRLTPDKQAKALASIERNAVAQAQLVDDLLDTSRIVSGKMRLDAQRVDVSQVVTAALESLRLALDSKQLALRLDVPSGLMVVADPARLQQVVWNLLSNAVKFTPPGGHIALSAREEGTDVAISVEDDGRGVPPELLRAIFERFRQVDGSITREVGGLGLGLAISKAITEMHGGSIEARSGGSGHGSTFTVRIPQARPGDERSERARDAFKARAKALEGVRVLLVEDDDDSRDLLVEVLGLSGAKTRACTSGAEALVALGNESYDVLLSDIGMHPMNGYELIGAVRRSNGAIAEIPAAALTAYARAEDHRKALDAGFQAYVTKPVDAAELTQTLASLARLGRDPREDAQTIISEKSS